MAPAIRPIPLNRAIAPFFIGVDLGGTSTKVGLVDDLGRPVCQPHEFPTCVNEGPEQLVSRVAETMKQMIETSGLEPTEIARVGLGCPGILDLHTGVMVNPTNFPGWGGFPIRERLTDSSGMPVVMVNDASAAAYGELWIGSGRGFRSLVFLTLGTGVGCGVIIGDVIIEGEHGHGTECGHILIDPSPAAPVCSCGQRGHLEAFASATAVVRRAREMIDAGKAPLLAEKVANGEKLTPLLLAKLAEGGDQPSLELILETGYYLGLGIVTLLHTFDPTGLLLGGAMTFGGEKSPVGRRFLERIQEEVHQRAFAALAQKVIIRFAALGGDAGFIGAAGIARLHHRRHR
ncbi:MAG: ROK family protein [Thermogutta sp.]